MDSPKGTVYIVEDNDSFRKSMIRLVQTLGYQAFAYETASDFLSQTRFESPGCPVPSSPKHLVIASSSPLSDRTGLYARPGRLRQTTHSGRRT